MVSYIYTIISVNVVGGARRPLRTYIHVHVICAGMVYVYICTFMLYVLVWYTCSKYWHREHVGSLPLLLISVYRGMLVSRQLLSLCTARPAVTILPLDTAVRS